MLNTNESHNSDASRWRDRLKKLTKPRHKKLEKDDEKVVEEYTSYAGDERGNIVVWDILPILNNLQKQVSERSERA